MTTTTHTTATGLGASGRTWRLDELLNEAGVQTLDGARVPAVAVRSLTDDSRRVGPGACFVAVPGSRQDGHVHIPAAVRAGATAIICSQCPSGPPVLQADGAEPVAVVPVCDARDALAQLAVCWWRVGPGQERALPLIGITGTNGKTTVAWMLRSILRAAGLRPALMGTIEYDLVGRQCAAPLTTPGAFALAEHLAEAADAGATHAVLEVSSHALHQRRTDGLGFAAGVFTNLSGDHLDYHGSMEAYFEAKSRLFLGERAAGTAVVNGDDPAGRRLQRAGQVGQRMVSYGLTSMGLDVTGRVVERTAAGTRFVAEGLGEPVRVSLPMVGEHNVYNALAAAVTASSLGVALDAVVAGLEGLAVVPGRLERVTPVDSPFAVFVDYAHTDDALDHVLAVLRRVTTGRLICVFGCGGDRDRSKRPTHGGGGGRARRPRHRDQRQPAQRGPAGDRGRDRAGVCRR